MHPLAAASRSRMLEEMEPKLILFETSYYAFYVNTITTLSDIALNYLSRERKPE